jgi:fermentation-respiration switch protein FrsA (DUF1100 family)
MNATLDDTRLAELLPGTWNVAATNFPMWLSGERFSPRFSYDLVSREPLVLADDVSFEFVDGQEKHILGQDVWRGDKFVWRGRGRLKLLASQWQVAGASSDGEIAVIRFAKSIATPSGVDVIVREGTSHPELRATIAHACNDFGLTPEDFASLTWLELRKVEGRLA